MQRRKFMGQVGVGAAATILPNTLLSFAPNATTKAASILKFGIVSDVHKDLMPDADERLQKFIDEAKARKVDFIIQMGDFCMAETENLGFMNIWKEFKGPRYHILGNHDMDKHSKQEMLDFWQMPKTYYSYDFAGIHFIVLDANFLYKDGAFIDYEKANFYVEDKYRTYIDDEQITWFKSDLAETKLPTIVFSHQSLWHYQWGVKNRLVLQKILEDHKEKVICCFNGHNHIDFHHQQNGIHYIEVNSMSYKWMSDKYTTKDRYPAAFYEQYKWLPNIAPYQDSLYAFASIYPEGTLAIEGVRSEWMSPSPYDLGMPKGVYGSECSAVMSDYNLEFDSKQKP